MASSDGDEHIVIAPRFLPELRKLPDSVLSFPKAASEVSLCFFDRDFLLMVAVDGVQIYKPRH